MAERGLTVIAGLLALTLSAEAQIADRTQDDLQAAIKLELVDGNLKAAVERFKALATSSRPEIAAEALVHLAACYEKLGQSNDARAAYERVLRQYSTQTTPVAAARAWLRAHPAAARPVNRQVWKSSGDRITADGRYISYAENGEVFVHDVTTGVGRRLTIAADQRPPREYAETTAISRDGRQVAYSWSIGPRYQLRVVSAVETGTAPRVLIDNEDIVMVTPLDWSADRARLAVRLARADRSGQIALVSARDGAVTVLKSVDWRGPMHAAFSPDGRKLAFDMSTDEKTGARDVFVLNTDGSGERTAVAHADNDILAGWTPDGQSLLFVSNRSGSAGLWKVSAVGNPATAKPELLRSDLGEFVRSLGLTQVGAFVYAQRTAAARIHTADVDFTTGRVLKPATPALETYLRGQRNPAWSPDGTGLAWSSPPPAPGQRGMASVHTFGSGRIHEVSPELSGGVLRGWAPDGSLVYHGTDLKGRPGIFRVSATDGATSALVTETEGFLTLPSWSADGKLVVYRRQLASTAALMLHDVASGTQRELVREQPLGLFGYAALSPDGKQAAYLQPLQQPRSIRLLSILTGETHVALEVSGLETISSFQWLPDSGRLLVWKTSNGTTTGSVIRLGGGPAVPLDPAIPEDARIDPSGRRVAYSAGGPIVETWSLENVLTPAK